MSDRKLLNTWKEIATYLQRGVRTVQRWEANYKMPVRRPEHDAKSVYAYADEIDAWMQRARPASQAYVRPTVLILEVITPAALSDVKLAVEIGKFNVLTAFTSAEILATAQRFDVDAFIIDSVMLDSDPRELGRELKSRFPSKLRILLGDESEASPDYDYTLPPGDNMALVALLIERLGQPRID